MQNEPMAAVSRKKIWYIDFANVLFFGLRKVQWNLQQLRFFAELVVSASVSNELESEPFGRTT
jgi:hypothetical protein